MYLSEFKYELPDRLIAQKPAGQRTGSRLMVVDRARGTITHDSFVNVKNYLLPGDCLVLNNTRVIPARLLNEDNCEILLLRETVPQISAPVSASAPAQGPASIAAQVFAPVSEEKSDGHTFWEVMVRPGKRFKKGSRHMFGNGRLTCEVTDTLPTGNRVVRFDISRKDFFAALYEVGHMPLPPYIKSRDFDRERYQTVYSKEPGSSAAPTAGLHFTKEYLEEISASGVDTAYLTLHVGQGTFTPVKTDIIEEHHMHSEYFRIDGNASRKINKVRDGSRGSGGTARERVYSGTKVPRVICVGTTSMRTVESAADPNGLLRPCDGWTDIFIYPGYKFRCADALITNFHLPGSTLLMLVCAFAGYELTMEAYRRAVEAEYRFFSFGDAMLIV